MIRTISISVASLLVGGCSLLGSGPAPSAAVPATLVGACEAMRPALPIRYHGGPDSMGGSGYDTPGTVAQIKDANARFRAACP